MNTHTKLKRQAVPVLQDALKYLGMYKAFTIKHDIPIAIRGKSNYLAALGLSVYTEGLGRMYNGSFAKGNSKPNYNTFIQIFFPREYRSVDSRLRNDNLGGLYGAIRVL